MKNFSDYPRRERTVIVAGIVLVCLGVLGLLNGYVAVSWWNYLLGGLVRLVRRLLPVALILLGVLVIWGSRTGRLHNLLHQGSGSGIHRSLTDRRILGVCGGIAQSRNVDSTFVRLAIILIFVAFPLLTTVAYILLAIAMQPE